MTDSCNRQRDIKLYGYSMAGLTLDPEQLHAGGNDTGALQLLSHAEAGLALIHAVSIKGQYQHLQRPTMILVEGKGAPAAGSVAGESDNDRGLTCWDCDADDMTLRLDFQCGPVDALLQGSADEEQGKLRLGGAMVTGRKVTPKVKSPNVAGRKVQPKARSVNLTGAMILPTASGTKVTGKKVTSRHKSPRVKPGYAGTKIA